MKNIYIISILVFCINANAFTNQLFLNRESGTTFISIPTEVHLLKQVKKKKKKKKNVTKSEEKLLNEKISISEENQPVDKKKKKKK